MRTLAVQPSNVKIDYRPLLYFGMGLLLTLSCSYQLLIAIFPSIFMQSGKEKTAFLLPTILLWFVSPVMLLQFWIFVVGYHLFAYFVRLCKGNMIQSNRFYVALCSFSIVYFTSHDLKTALCFLAIQMITYHEIMKSFEWLKNDHFFTSEVKALVILAIALLISQYMPMYQEVVLTLAIMLICFKCSMLMSIACFLFLNMMKLSIGADLFIMILLLSLLKDWLGLMLIVYGALMIQISSIEEMLMLGLYLVFLILLSTQRPIVQDELLHASNSKAFLHQQLMNFSLIFDHLGTYYENVSQVESEFLKNMSNALNYTSKKCIQDERSADFVRNQVISLLEGYHIGYEEICVQLNPDGFIDVQCSLTHFSAREVEEVLLPLLNHLLPTPMECSLIRSSLLHLGVLHVRFVSALPIQIDVYADSVPTGSICGDSFSIFHHARNVYCLISDGMGIGKEASKISKCIVNLFQRMIFSGIHEIEAMNCINKLLLSDAYATCDVLSFDRYKKSVVICKSAANPTYLIRNKELFVIWGNSLPIGIVAHIDVDHIHVQVEKGDWFIMSSDGVCVEEILMWMKQSENKNARFEVERMIEMMKTRKREDDSTILLAKVQ